MVPLRQRNGITFGFASVQALRLRFAPLSMTMAALLLYVTLLSAAKAEWKVASSQREMSPNELVAHWHTTVQNEKGGQRAEFHVAVFNTRRATLEAIDQANDVHRDLAETMQQNHCLAGVNGGYFDAAGAPVGLLVSDGRRISPLRKARLLSGVLSATSTKVDIVRAARFSMSEKILAAVQCGPFLVEGATPVAGLNESDRARRTFAAVDGRGSAAIGISSSVSLAQLGKILCLTNVAGEMKIVRALNLDGGSSSAFWFRGKMEAVSIAEEKSVCDFVAIVER